MAEIDEDFQPELIVRASPQDKARARRRRSMVETEPTGSLWKKVVGAIMVAGFGLMLFAVILSWFELQRTSRTLGMFVGRIDTTSQTMELFVLAAIFGGGVFGGIKLFQAGSGEN